MTSKCFVRTALYYHTVIETVQLERNEVVFLRAV